MGSLQSAFDLAIADIPKKLVEHVLKKKLDEKGIKLSDRKFKKIRDYILSDSSQPLQIHDWRWWKDDQIEIDFDEKDIEEIKVKSDEIIKTMPEMVRSASAEASLNILSELAKRWKSESKKQKKERKEFQHGLRKIWGQPLEDLRMFLTLARDFGAALNDKINVSDEGYLADILIRLQGRACQVMEEIILLLESGLADGAMARWRTLHEIATVVHLLQKFGEEIAERYALHDIVESRKAMQAYRLYRERLGQPDIDENEAAKIEAEYKKVIDRFGDSFALDYGWAAHHLQKKKPTLFDLEVAAGIDHLRPYYRLASHNVHANPKGIFSRLGILPESSVILAGTSNLGLSDPGHSAAISLGQICISVGQVRPDFDDLVIMQILAKMITKIGGGFGSAHNSLVENEEDMIKTI